MNIKISVIIPIYNAEKYLSETLDSVLNQSFTDFEVIAINDGSKDNSLSILRKYEKRDKRIRVIDKPNTGVSDTRNIGIDEAQGEYICFVDADDLLNENYLLKMYSCAKKYNSKLIICRYITFRNDKKIKYTENMDINYVDDEKLLITGLMTPIWNKLICRELLNKYEIKFDINMEYGEDLFFSWKSYLGANSAVLMEDSLYDYRLNEGGAANKYHENLYEKYLYGFKDLKEFSLRNKLNIKNDLVDVFFTKRIPSFVRMEVRSKKSILKKYRMISLILSDKIIKNTINNNWNELTKGESKRNIRYCKYAKEHKIMFLIMDMYISEKKYKLASILKK